MISPLMAFAGGVFATFTLTAIESIEKERKLKETVAELQNPRATVTALGQQIAWQNYELLQARERAEKAENEKKAADRSWNGKMVAAVVAVSGATIVAMCREMR